MPTNLIKKRNGSLVEFDVQKIENAVRKAYLATSVTVGDEDLFAISHAVEAEIAQNFPESTPSVEDVQDLVEKKIAERGDFEVARSYIIYRVERKKLREQEQQELLKKLDQ